MSSADAHRHDPTHPVHARRRSSSRYPVEVIRSDKRNKTVSARIVDGVIRVRIPAWMTAEDEARFVDDVVELVVELRDPLEAGGPVGNHDDVGRVVELPARQRWPGSSGSRG